MYPAVYICLDIIIHCLLAFVAFTSGQASSDKGVGGPPGHYAPAAPVPLPPPVSLPIVQVSKEASQGAYEKPKISEEPALLRDPPTMHAPSKPRYKR